MVSKALVADKMIGWLGREAPWCAFQGNIETDFSISEATLDQAKVLSGGPPLCCFEVPMLAARELDANLKSSISVAVGKVVRGGFKASSLCKSSPRKYPGSVEKGDLVFYNDLGHVALATGEKISGETVIVSFWTMNPMMAQIGALYTNRKTGEPDTEKNQQALADYTNTQTSPGRITLTTVEIMGKVLQVVMKKSPAITYGVPFWA